MPYTSAQRRLFHAAEENPSVARKHDMKRGEATKLADEADKLRKRGKEKKASIGFIDLTPVFGSATR